MKNTVNNLPMLLNQRQTLYGRNFWIYLERESGINRNNLVRLTQSNQSVSLKTLNAIAMPLHLTPHDLLLLTKENVTPEDFSTWDVMATLQGHYTFTFKDAQKIVPKAELIEYIANKMTDLNPQTVGTILRKDHDVNGFSANVIRAINICLTHPDLKDQDVDFFIKLADSKLLELALLRELKFLYSGAKPFTEGDLMSLITMLRMPVDLDVDFMRSHFRFKRDKTMIQMDKRLTETLNRISGLEDSEDYRIQNLTKQEILNMISDLLF